MAIKYLSGNRTYGTAAEIPTIGGVTGWTELGRTTLGSAGDSINVANFAAYDYLMVLTHAIESGVIIPSYQFNGDTGNNYTIRYSLNGGSDGTVTSQGKIQWQNAGTADTNFGVGIINNPQGTEKLVLQTGMKSDTGAGNAPAREEIVAKWANTSAQITTVNVMNTQSGDFAAGSEVVILGSNSSGAGATSAWQELADVTLSSDGDLIDSNTFTAKKYLMIEAVGYRTNASIIPALRVGNGTLDTGSNYARRQSVNGGSDGTVTGQSSMGGDSGAGYLTKDVYFIVNKADQEKLIINHCIITGSGAGSAPDRAEIVGKWANTSAQINRIGYLNVGGGSSDFGAGSSIKVWGMD